MNNIVKILLCVAVALVLLIVLLICGVMMTQKTPDTEETTLPSIIATTAVTETTEETTEATTEPNYNPGQGEDGHTHDFFTVPAGQNATWTRAAKIHRLCRICQHGVIVDDPDNPPLGHDYQVNIVVQPTTTSKGYTNYKCTRCSDSYDADYVDPLPAHETQASVIETQAPVVDSQATGSDSGNTGSDS